MNFRKGIFTGILSVLSFVSSLQYGHAQRQPVIAAPPLIGDSVKTGKTLTVQDTVWYNSSLASHIAQTKSLDNIVALYIDEYSNKVLPDSFQVMAAMRVHWARSATDTGSTLDTLSISYHKDSTYTSKATKFYKDYHSVQVELMNVAITDAPADSVRRFLVLENMIVLERYFTTDCTAISEVTHTALGVLVSGELAVSWEAVPFIPLYELEWTFIDSSALLAGNYTVGGDLDADLIFKNNSTRVQLAGHNYGIPLLYDGGGRLFYRVRTLQYAPDNEVIAGSWSSDAGEDGFGQYAFHGHERKLNWQSTTSFAEEGKRKSVVQYFDGSLKGRQTVTKDNTTHTTVVAETLYDKQGRPAIQVLPAPTLDAIIKYNPMFNVRGINTAEYDKSVYDTLITDNDFCAEGADSMSSTIGANQYYSPLNPLANGPGADYHKFVPNAHGYAFAETRYTRDNTGRIDRQGGVGDSLRIGTGHETKYFYGSPTQRELDALFGTEAGDASHYEKNMVRDANGQYSVSYVDMHGRTVATALAGAAPKSLQQLASFDSLTQKDDLLYGANNVIQDNSIRSVSSLTVPVADTFLFEYKLSPESLSLSDCKDSTICYDCLYDLTITISDNCSNQQFGGSPKVVKFSNFTLYKTDSTTFNLDTTCKIADTIHLVFPVPLAEGSYDITKVLSMSKPAMQYYRDSIYIPHNTCKSYHQLVLEQLDSIRQHLDCTPDSAVTNLMMAYREQMMADLTPTSGQYAADITPPDGYSIFSKLGGLYRYQTVSGYKDEDGNAAVVVIYDQDGNPQQYAPQQLSPEDFIANFRDSWAEALLPLHREYPLLIEYANLKSAYNWEADYFATETFADAVAKGYLNPTGSATAPASNFTVSGMTDSLFTALNAAYGSTVMNAAKSSINDSLFKYLVKTTSPSLTYYTLWGISTGMVKCQNSEAACYAHWDQSANVFNTDSLCAGDLDQAWRMFQTQYLRFREGWIDTYLRARTGINAEFINAPYVPVFPSNSIAGITAMAVGAAGGNETYGGYNGNAGDSTAAHTNLDAYLLANCQAYAEKWWEELAPCGYTAEDKDSIINRLIAVAYNGADADHPFGSSTVRPGSNNRDQSFEEVIREYNDVKWGVGNWSNTTCNGYLITNPKPYDQPTIIVNRPIISKPDSCSCARINELYNQFLVEQSTYHTFVNYMQTAHGTHISADALDSLRNLCNTTSNCTYLEKPIILPPALQCGTGEVCVSCMEVKALYDTFRVNYPGAVPAYEDTADDQSIVNKIFTNFMNQHLGFTKLHTDYLAFMDSCGIDTTPHLACDSLEMLQAEYKAIYKEVRDGKAASGYRVTPIFDDLKNGMNGLLEWRRRGSTGRTLSPRYRYQPTDYILHNQFYEIAYTTTSGSDSLFNLVMPLNIAWLDNSEGLLNTMINAQTVSGAHFTGSYTPDDLTKKYYGVSILDEWARWRIMWGSRGLWAGNGECNPTYTGIAVQYGVSAPDSAFLDDSCILQLSPNFSAAFYKLPASVTTFTQYKNYIDSIRIKVTLDFDAPIPPNPPLYDTLHNSTAIYQFEDIKRIVDFHLDTLWLQQFKLSPYFFTQNGDLVMAKLEMMDGSFQEAHYMMYNSPMVTKEHVDTVIYGTDCQAGFAKYFNTKRGTNYTFNQIDSIYQSVCGKQVTVCAVESCDTSAWTVYSSGNDLRMKDDLYSNAYNNINTSNLLFNDGYFNSPSTSEANHYLLVNKRDSIDAGSSNVLMQWRVKPDSVMQMINPLAQRGSSGTYLGATWAKDPADTTWWISSTTLSGADGNIIKGVGLQSGSNSLKADWVKLTNATTGDTLYLENFVFISGSCASSDVFGPFLCGKQAADSTIILGMNPCADTLFGAQEAATYLFDIYNQKLKGEFERAYSNKCMQAGRLESFTVTRPLSEYHYTLYYYDQAGNLIKTVPPEGVDVIRRPSWMDSVTTARNNGTVLRNAHRMATTYRYNSLNQVIQQHSPDGGLSKFWYDRLGRLVVSQNAQQALPVEGQPEGASNYSYTLYDQLGRISEVGQKLQETAMSDGIAKSQSLLASWQEYTYEMDETSVIAEQVTKTVYDAKDPETGALPNSGYVLNPSFQKTYTLRNRVSHTNYYDKLVWSDGAAQYDDYDNGSIYSYDIHGNVDTLLNHYKTGMMADGHGYNMFKSIAYKYDLISGKVNEVHYQPGMADEFYHRYEYDAENKLTDVYTIDRKQLINVPALEEHDVRYTYYKHGPLARTVLGQQQVQGIDYAYTLQGLLKGVNSDSLVDEDGKLGSIVGQDAYKFSLNYFNNDYKAIGDAITNNIFAGHSGQLPTEADYRPLYNGNISSMVVGIPKVGETMLYNYGYDQLNRIVSMDAYTGYNGPDHSWGTLNAHSGEYKERVAYDANGNILKYLRNGHRGQLNMDSLNYNYNRDGADYLTNNRLRQVRDAVSDGNYTEDIDNQSSLDNYEYDAIGNLTKDVKEGISSIKWTVYGKIRNITKTDGTIINYTYDVDGNRISKAVTKDGTTTTTWYSRDAQGNPMAIYTGTATSLALTEQSVYGSSRAAVWNRNVNMDVAVDDNSNIFVRGNKFFELSNHLGNVLVTVSDKKIGVDANTDGTVDYYTADVTSAQDYYVFGQLQPGRQYGTKGRYLFNGKEQDPEAKGAGAQYDYGFRIYDPRLGRFLSVDPLTKSFAALTPYQYASNNPVEGIDLDGLEYVSSEEVRIEVIRGVVKLKVENMTTVVKNMLTDYNNDPKNWAPNSIGADFSVGRINLSQIAPQAPDSDPDPSDANPNNRADQTEVGKPIAKSTGLPDRRYKDRAVTTASPAGAKGLALLSIGIDLVVTGTNLYIQNRVEKDQGLINTHFNSFKAAASDVNYALKNTTLIPKEFQTEERLSDIINVVLSGNSFLNSIGDEAGAKILEIGKNIYNTLSIKRKEYTGRVIETSKIDNYSNRILERNPAYDAEYVKQNPPLGEQPKPNQ